MKTFLRTLLFTAALSACAGQAPSEPAFDLGGTSWRRVDDMDANPHGATLQFGADGRASGSTGCNRWFSAVTRDEHVLTFGSVGMTRMACQAEVQMATERNFTAMLPRAQGWSMDGEELVFTDQAGAEIARFVRED